MMSLFLGNLPPRIRHSELERVFQKFGRCNIQLKDGYGFVLYDIVGNAERALQSLRDTKICGEEISLTWANKKHQPLPRFMRNNRFSRPYRWSSFNRKENITRNRGSQDSRVLRTGSEHANNYEKEVKRVNLLDKETESGLRDGREKFQSPIEEMLDIDGSVELKPLENDRWGESISDPNDQQVEDGTQFDRCEPYHGFDKREDNDKHQRTGSYGSPPSHSFTEKALRVCSSDANHNYMDNLKPSQCCYNCGSTGHILRNCPKADSLRRKKGTRFSRRRDPDIRFCRREERDLKRLRPGSWGRLDGNRDAVLSRKDANNKVHFERVKDRYTTDRKHSFLNHEKNRWFHCRKESGYGERSRRKQKNSNRHQVKKRRSASLSRDSDKRGSHSSSYSSWSRSHLDSSKALSAVSSRSRSRSVSSSSHSSSTSRSSSVSSSSRSRSSISRSRSLSPQYLSLPVSLDPFVPSDSVKNISETVTCIKPNKSLVDERNCDGDLPSDSVKNIFETVTCSKHNKSLLDERKYDGDQVSEHLELKRSIPGQNDANKFDTQNMEVNVHGNHVGEGDQSKIDEKSEERSPFGFEKSEERSPCIINLGIKDFTIEKSSPLDSRERKNDHKTELEDKEVKRTLYECMFGSHVFDAARLWPWEVIYHRRLKKGPISTENYERRLAENREFSIIDKYVRSSSGWGEHGNESLSVPEGSKVAISE
ncbi:serine/arginine-rich splicing factor 4 isoform X2 [Amborella trichopoda]|uniref:serine/arginine-rich splicing factor 4 isoform X2 n=1 Tax=Amborella trichopoda TaxID=13333 RepID=UPI0009BCA943|nr:serine/arginine-rich splicing factor 4 isoform X2 [Amborella trichopoda]|eukprot:XP_020529377.1 serine/arginine-rich splicing factor 4 isoform X2 [Amborella trichopoda]